MKNAARNAEIVRLRKEGVGPREIARRMGISPNVVSGVLYKGGLTSEPRGRGHGATPAYRAAVLESIERIGWRETARLWGHPAGTLSRWRRMKEGGV